MPFIRSISGLRATLGDDLTPAIVAEYSSAFANFSPEGKIIVGFDGRPSGKWISMLVCTSLIAAGRDAIFIGMVPTPTVQIAIELEKAAGGIVVTASHNDENWNGLKFLNSRGIFLDAEENREFYNIVDEKSSKYSKSKFHSMGMSENAIKFHIEKILEIEILKSNITKIQKRKFKVVLDAVNASGSFAVSDLLEKLNCKVIPLYADGNGDFPHNPEPLPQNLTELSKKVKKSKAALGIAVDPDADRLVLIDENGNPIGEELTVAIAIDSVFNYYYGKRELIAAVNFSTSRVCEAIAENYNGKVHRCPVGEINVVKKMKEVEAIIGGEGSGGVILPECHYGRDSLVGIALLLSLLADKGVTLSELTASYPKFHIKKYKKEFYGSLDAIRNKIIEEFKDFELNTEDGFYLKNDICSVQLRKSNTEPIIRIIAESKDENLSLSLIERVKNLISNG